MNPADIAPIVIGALEGLVSSTAFILVLFIGFCVLVGFTKIKKTTGNAPVVKSLEESLTHEAVRYLPPNAPRGPADQLRSPELTEKARLTQSSPVASASPS